MSNYSGRDQYMECARILANMAVTMFTYMKCASAAILDMDRMIHECDSLWRHRSPEAGRGQRAGKRGSVQVGGDVPHGVGAGGKGGRNRKRSM